MAAENTTQNSVGKPFKKGTSGNPGGRPKALADVVALAREHTLLAVQTLAEIASNAKAPEAAEFHGGSDRMVRAKVVGFDHYEVSDTGAVRSVDRWTGEKGKKPFFLAGKAMRLKVDTAGYYRVNLCRNGKKIGRTVHSLVAEAFLGRRPAGHQICHFDGNPKNNTLANLRYDTPASNTLDKLRHGTHRRGGNHPLARLTKFDVWDIKNGIARGLTHTALAKQFGVSRAHVSGIASGRKWPDLGEASNG